MRLPMLLLALAIPLVSFADDSVDDALGKVLTKQQYDTLSIGALTAAQKRALLEALQSAYAAGQAKSASPHQAPRTGSAQTVPSTPPALAPAPVTIPSTNPKATMRSHASPSEAIESQIDGDFEGWEGETVVKLTNGQIWQQTEYYYEYYYSYMPDVLIYPSSSGPKMKVDGTDQAVGVRRLK